MPNPEHPINDQPCGHVPARPDVDLTLCWKCGVEIIPDPGTHLWRPLTAAEILVKHETIRRCRELFLTVTWAEYLCALDEWLAIREQPAIRLAESIMGRWIIVHGQNPDLAWSGSRWVPHTRGLPINIQVCNFETRQQAHEYAVEHFTPAS